MNLGNTCHSNVACRDVDEQTHHGCFFTVWSLRHNFHVCLMWRELRVQFAEKTESCASVRNTLHAHHAACNQEDFLYVRACKDLRGVSFGAES